mgnify:CR=1
MSISERIQNHIWDLRSKQANAQTPAEREKIQREIEQAQKTLDKCK